MREGTKQEDENQYKGPLQGKTLSHELHLVHAQCLLQCNDLFQ